MLCSGPGSHVQSESPGDWVGCAAWSGWQAMSGAAQVRYGVYGLVREAVSVTASGRRSSLEEHPGGGETNLRAETIGRE